MYTHGCSHCKPVNEGVVARRDRKVGAESWADQPMAAHSLRINKGGKGKEKGSEDRTLSNPMLSYTLSKPTLSNRTFCNNGDVLYLCC